MLETDRTSAASRKHTGMQTAETILQGRCRQRGSSGPGRFYAAQTAAILHSLMYAVGSLALFRWCERRRPAQCVLSFAAEGVTSVVCRGKGKAQVVWLAWVER